MQELVLDAPAVQTLDYPGRKLGFRRAATCAHDAYDDRVWANIAAANMRTADTFSLGGKNVMVVSISDKTLKLVDHDGHVRTLNPDRENWEPFQRALGEQIAVENLQANTILKPAPARRLIEILKRDPAVHVDERGSVYVSDAVAKAAPAEDVAQAPRTRTAKLY